MASRILLPALVVLLAVGCAPQQQVDREAEVNAILEADRAWSQTPPNADEFVAFFMDDGLSLGGGVPAARGYDAIRAVASEDFNAPGAALQWSASEADVSACGDLGYSIGTYEQTVNDSAGNPVKTKGKYVTVWEKQQDASWKVAVDSYSDDGPSAVVRTSVPAGPDPVEVDSDHYKLEFENEHVRILRITYGPLEKSVMHEHPASVAVFLADDQHWRFTAPDGTTEETAGKIGETAWREAGKHLPENLDDEPQEVILVELKSKND